MEYIPTIGLEIHAELKTQTKMFCACRNDADETRPNVNICPVCMAHPGALPVINREAVHKVLLVGSAVGGRLADRTVFDRKNYFYPDIPKGYQISQYKDPLVLGGSLADVLLTRIHLEEDTASSQHVENLPRNYAENTQKNAEEILRNSASGLRGSATLVDFNRAGVPLMELVTEPVIHSAEDAGRFARELQLLLRTLGASEANMEKGEMRVEANISVSRTVLENGLPKDRPLGTKVEVKNLNSFRSVERAIRFEVERQMELIESGGTVLQETRGWDEGKQTTFSQRKKESSHDYRYFPEPDLPELRISEIPEFSSDTLRTELPELPRQKRERYLGIGLKSEDAEMFVAQPAAGRLFDAATEHLGKGDERVALTANYVANDLAGKWEKFEPASLATLIEYIAQGKMSSRGAKDALAEAAGGGDLIQIAENYLQQSDAGALEAVAKKIADANPSVVADYRAGKQAALQFLIGQGMKETKGSANPALLRAALEKLLG